MNNSLYVVTKDSIAGCYLAEDETHAIELAQKALEPVTP